MSKPKRVLFVPDCHHPFVDEQAWCLMLRAARIFKPDIIIVLGDFADFYAVSSHSKDPRRAGMLDQEIEDVKIALSELDALGAKQKVYIAGNHEHRLHRYLCDKAPALFGAVSISQLLGLRARGWYFVDYHKTYRLGKLRITHDLGKSGKNAHRDALGTFRHSVVIGHNHLMEMSVVGNPEQGGSSAVGASFGWLGSFDAIDYMQEAAARSSWSHGFGVGYMLDNGVVLLQPVPIVGGVCVVGSEVIS